jgi:tRNA (guanine-N7-)-methyltransferase
VHGCALPGDEAPDWPREFGRAPEELILELEIGPGRGGFALDHAQAHPEIDLVAIETRRSDCEQIRARARKRNLSNLVLLQGDAKLLVPRCFAPGQLAALHVQFPDPWWKKRHHKRRMVDVDLAALARTLLRAGGTVDFRTDVSAYAVEAVLTWQEAGFVNLDGQGALCTFVPEILSTRERRYAVTGQPVFRARFVNPEVVLPPRVPDARGGAWPVGGEGDEGPSGARVRTGREWTDARRK